MQENKTLRHFHVTSLIQKDNEVSHERVVIDDMVRGMGGDQTLDFELCRVSRRLFYFTLGY